MARQSSETSQPIHLDHQFNTPCHSNCSPQLSFCLYLVVSLKSCRRLLRRGVDSTCSSVELKKEIRAVDWRHVTFQMRHQKIVSVACRCLRKYSVLWSTFWNDSKYLHQLGFHSNIWICFHLCVLCYLSATSTPTNCFEHAPTFKFDHHITIKNVNIHMVPFFTHSQSLGQCLPLCERFCKLQFASEFDNNLIIAD